jgi:hypothetical protein
MSSSEYHAYLESPEWLERRRAVLLRAGDRCELCRFRQATQVHHLTYERIGDEWLSDLIAVCRDCHELEHDEESEEGCEARFDSAGEWFFFDADTQQRVTIYRKGP